MSERDPRYTIGELARLGGVSRRTVRYYVQRDLLPAPLGRGRGGHYDDQHLQRLLRIRTLQEQGSSLDDIRAALAGKATPPPPPARPSPIVRRQSPANRASAWVRVELAEGVELHLAADQGLPGPRATRELREAVLRILGDPTTDDPGTPGQGS